MPINLLLYSTGTALLGAIRGLGKYALGTAILFILGYLIGMPLTYMLSFYFELDIAGLWLSQIIRSILVLVVVSIYLGFVVDWKRLAYSINF
mmetsp:Transcript_16536/g.15836  ORF Transcript_16536/g.15836 Transcript_16536/m.15836 type:complete len:92 (-) Transcript_16536:108-383(-)